MPNREVKRWAEQYVMDDEHGGGVTYPATGGTSDIYEGNTPKAQTQDQPRTQDQPDAYNAGGNTIQGYTVNGYTVPDYQYGSWSYNPYQRSGFSYKDAPEYINRYQEQIDNLANQIQHWQGFSYNYNTDPLYQQYAEAYNRNGQNAMRNTLAQMAARTGGMASSYAGTAAQNAYNEYMQGLNDKVPELYQLAYGMYNDKLNKQRNDLSMLEALEQGDYAKYVDLLNQYNTDRNMAYNVWNTTEGAREDADRAKAQYDYNVWKAQQDNAYDVWSMQQNAAYNTWKAQNDANYAAWKYQQDQAASDRAYEQNLALKEKQYQQELALQELKNGGKTGGSPESTADDTSASNYDRLDAAYQNMLNSGAQREEIAKEIQNAYSLGLISREEYTQLSTKYGVSSSPTVNRYEATNNETITEESSPAEEAIRSLTENRYASNNTGKKNVSLTESRYNSNNTGAEKTNTTEFNYNAPKYSGEPDDYEQLVESENRVYESKEQAMREYGIEKLKKQNPGAYNRLMDIIKQTFEYGTDVQYRLDYIDKYLKAYGVGG